jgi:hypothetical protein
MTIADLADALAKQGVEVRRILTQTTHRPGVSPDVVVPVGLELGNGLWLDQGMGDDRMTLYRWDPEDEWVEIGEYQSAQVGDLIKAIKEYSSGHDRA